MTASDKLRYDFYRCHPLLLFFIASGFLFLPLRTSNTLTNTDLQATGFLADMAVIITIMLAPPFILRLLRQVGTGFRVGLARIGGSGSLACAYPWHLFKPSVAENIG